MTDSRPGATNDLTISLASLASRLTELEQATAGLDRRLAAIESVMPLPTLHAPAAAARTVAVAAANAPAQPPLPATAAPERSATGQIVEEIDAIVDRLLDGQPSQGRTHTEPARITPRPPSPQPRPARAAIPRSRPSLELRNLEHLISGRGLAWVGGLALLLGALFFLSLAISRGWIGPEARVVIGLIAGIGITFTGERLLRGREQILAPVLIAVGIGIWNLSLVAGTRLYDVIPLGWALLGAAAGAVIATAYALRTNAQIIALYGLLTAMAAPMLFDVPDASAPIPYLGIILAGSTAVSIARGWWWLPPASFALSQIQFYAWWLDTDAPTSMVILAIVALTLIHIIAAAGVELRSISFRAHLIAVALLILNALSFTIVGVGEMHESRNALGAFLLIGVAVHVGVGVTVLRRKRFEQGFAMLAFALAVILLTIAIAAVFSGPLMAVGWGLEALGLVWLAQRYRNPAGFWGAAIVYGLAVSHLFLVELQLLRPVNARTMPDIPFVNVAGLTLLALLTLLLGAGAIVRERWSYLVFATIGFGILIAAMPLQLSGLALLAAWALLAVGSLAADRLLAVHPGSMPIDPIRARSVANALPIAATIAAALAIGRAIFYEMPLLTDQYVRDTADYVGQPIAATAIIAAAALAAIAVTRSAAVRQMAGSIALLITAHLAAFLLDPAFAVAAWSILAVVAWGLQQRVAGPTRAFLATATLLLICGVGMTIVTIAPPERLLVTAGGPMGHPLLWSDATLALGSLALACFAISWHSTMPFARGWLGLAGGVCIIYLLSIGIVDEFQGRVTDATSVAELQRQSQVALSILWAVLGGIMIAAGLVRAIPALRWFGLGLLALATVKVFLFDLSSLDAAYRVMSFLVLGLLLLLSSYAYQRFGSPAEERDRHEPSEALSGEVGDVR